MNENIKEQGFSLVEMAVACAIAVVIAAVGILTIPNLLTDTKTKTEAYEACSFQRETELNNMIDGNIDIKSTCAPTATPTQ